MGLAAAAGVGAALEAAKPAKGRAGRARPGPMVSESARGAGGGRMGSLPPPLAAEARGPAPYRDTCGADAGKLCSDTAEERCTTERRNDSDLPGPEPARVRPGDTDDERCTAEMRNDLLGPEPTTEPVTSCLDGPVPPTQKPETRGPTTRSKSRRERQLSFRKAFGLRQRPCPGKAPTGPQPVLSWDSDDDIPEVSLTTDPSICPVMLRHRYGGTDRERSGSRKFFPTGGPRL